MAKPKMKPITVDENWGGMRGDIAHEMHRKAKRASDWKELAQVVESFVKWMNRERIGDHYFGLYLESQVFRLVGCGPQTFAVKAIFGLMRDMLENSEAGTQKRAWEQGDA